MNNQKTTPGSALYRPAPAFNSDPEPNYKDISFEDTTAQLERTEALADATRKELE